MELLFIYLMYDLFALSLSQNTLIRPPVRFDDNYWYDRFGNPTTLPMAGGHAVFSCHLNLDTTGRRVSEDGQVYFVCWGNETATILDPDNEPIAPPTACARDSYRRIYFRLNFSESTKAGRYRCKYDEYVEPDKTALLLPFVACDNRESTCQNSQPCHGRICAIESDAKRSSCYDPRNNDACRQPMLNAMSHCPVYARSLCLVTERDYARVWAVTPMDGCPDQEEATPRIRYASIVRSFSDVIELDTKHKEILVEYKNNAALDGLSVECNWTDVVFSRTQTERAVLSSSPNTIVRIPDRLFDDSCNIYGMSCYIGEWRLPWYLSNTFVSLGGKLNIIGPTATSQQLECRLTPEPPRDFTIEYEWTRRKDFEVELPRERIIAFDEEPDLYQCHAVIKYRSCTPFRQFGISLDSPTISVVATGGAKPEKVTRGSMRPGETRKTSSVPNDKTRRHQTEEIPISKAISYSADIQAIKIIVVNALRAIISK